MGKSTTLAACNFGSRGYAKAEKIEYDNLRPVYQVVLKLGNGNWYDYSDTVWLNPAFDYNAGEEARAIIERAYSNEEGARLIKCARFTEDYLLARVGGVINRLLRELYSA